MGVGSSGGPDSTEMGLRKPDLIERRPLGPTHQCQPQGLTWACRQICPTESVGVRLTLNPKP